MNRRWIPAGVAAGLVALLALASRDRPAPAPPGSNPAWAEVSGLLQAAYDVGDWGARVPVEWAAPRLGRVGLRAWVATLPLADDVRGRVEARLDQPGFVDELVPFALFIKEMYAEPEEPSFEAWAAANLVARPGAPVELSTEHSAPEAESSSSGLPAISAEKAALFLRLYDAVYLADRPAGAGIGERLVCGGDDEALEARMQRALPIVRELLTAQHKAMAPGDMRDAVGHALSDDTTLEAITLSLVEFVDSEVCKHHRIFSGQVQRERQIAAWLDTALRDPDRDDAWTWLRWLGTRRHAVHIVVDGLQGHLVSALARGEAGDPFLTQVVADIALDEQARPAARSTSHAPETHEGFIQYIAQNGYDRLLPNLAAIVASPRYVTNGLSTTPTISVRNLPVAMTGAPVAGEHSTGIPNFHFVDRGFVREGVQQGRPWYFYGNDALRLTALTEESGMIPMFERFERLVTMSCSGQYDERAGYSFDGFLNLAIGEAHRDFGERRCVAELQRRAANEARIRQLADEILAREAILHQPHHPWELWDRWQQLTEADAAHAAVAELAQLIPESMPDYLLVYNPWPDHFAHGKGPFADEIVGPTGELARLDHWLGRLQAVYTEAGVSDTTLWGMAGDHGLSSVRWIVSPEAEFIEGLRKRGVDLVVKKISSDEGEGPKLTHRLRPPSMRGIDVVVASTAGGNYMMDFFVDQGENWARQPVFSELRALRTLGGDMIDVPAELLARLGDSLDYIVLREAPCSPEGGVTLVMAPGAGRASVGTIERRGDRIWYGWEGADPLGLEELSRYLQPSEAEVAEAGAIRARCLAAIRSDPLSWCTEADWRAATRLGERQDAVGQLAHLYDTDRAGTVNLFPRRAVGYNTKVPGRHAGESFHEKDAFVGIWGEPVTGPAPAARLTTNGSVPMALAQWLTGEPSVPGRDGWGWEGVP